MFCYKAPIHRAVYRVWIAVILMEAVEHWRSTTADNTACWALVRLGHTTYVLCVFLNPCLYPMLHWCADSSCSSVSNLLQSYQYILYISFDVIYSMDLIFMQQLNGLDSLAAPNYVINIITIITTSLRYCQVYEYWKGTMPVLVLALFTFVSTE